MPEGYCHICGVHGPLSFEHIPPECAFNDRPIFLQKAEDIWREGPTFVGGEIQQQGSGRYSLCAKCNNDTGGWYARAFGEWCVSAAEMLDRSGGMSGYLANSQQIFPLRVLKQIITMFFSVNSPTFRERYPDLEDFIRNKEAQYLDPRYSVHAYLRRKGGMRLMPLARELDIYDGRNSYFTEISFYPLGYVLTIDSKRWDRRWFDISHFDQYGYKEQRGVPMALPILPTHLPIPGDHRTMEEIQLQALLDDAA